jgi:hypothetical protein
MAQHKSAEGDKTMYKISIHKTLVFLTALLLSLVLIFSGTANVVKAAEVQEPAVQEPAEKPDTREPDAKKPAAGEQGAEKPENQEPASGEQSAQDPDNEKPAAGEQGAQDPENQESDAGEQGAQDPDDQEPDAGEPDAQDPENQEPDAGEPDVQDPDIQEPAAGESDAQDPDDQEPDAGEPDVQDPDIQEAATGEQGAQDPEIGEIPMEEDELTEEDEFLEEDPAVDELPEEEIVTITTSGDTDMRVAPDGMSEIILTIPGGTELPVLAVEGDWVQVTYMEETGWIYRGNASDLSEEETVYAPKKVTIFTSRRMQMNPGETIHLTSILEGFEDCEAIKYQWECDKGNGFEAVPDGNGDRYAYSASVESLSWSWRLIVLFR